MTLEQQLPGRRAQSSTAKSYTECFGQSSNQFDQLSAPVVTFYSIKSRLHVGGDTTNTMGAKRTGYCNVVSATNEIELAFIINRDNKTTTLDTMRIGDNDTVSTATAGLPVS